MRKMNGLDTKTLDEYDPHTPEMYSTYVKVLNKRLQYIGWNVGKAQPR